MKTLEIILRLIDQLLSSLAFRKAQNERDKIETDSANWFADHFNSSMFSESTSKTNKTNTTSTDSK